MALDPASPLDDVDALKRLIVSMAREAVHANALIEKLRSELARLKRAQFGVSSERLKARVKQLELAIKALEVDEAERLAAALVVADAVEATRKAGPASLARSSAPQGRNPSWSLRLPVMRYEDR